MLVSSLVPVSFDPGRWKRWLGLTIPEVDIPVFLVRVGSEPLPLVTRALDQCRFVRCFVPYKSPSSPGLKCHTLCQHTIRSNVGDRVAYNYVRCGIKANLVCWRKHAHLIKRSPTRPLRFVSVNTGELHIISGRVFFRKETRENDLVGRERCYTWVEAVGELWICVCSEVGAIDHKEVFGKFWVIAGNFV